MGQPVAAPPGNTGRAPSAPASPPGCIMSTMSCGGCPSFCICGGGGCQVGAVDIADNLPQPSPHLLQQRHQLLEASVAVLLEVAADTRVALVLRLVAPPIVGVHHCSVHRQPRGVLFADLLRALRLAVT